MNVHSRLCAAFISACFCAQGQWLNNPTPNAPRTPDGKVNMSGPVPRSNGKPDLSGVWQIQAEPRGAGLFGLGESPNSKYFRNILADFKPEDEPLTPAGREIRRLHNQPGVVPPFLKCLPDGVPHADVLPEPFKIIQAPGETLILYEVETIFRQIFTDGRELPADPSPAWLGYSIGKWDGDTFVIDTLGFNDLTWLDRRGHGIPRRCASRNGSGGAISDTWKLPSRYPIPRSSPGRLRSTLSSSFFQTRICSSTSAAKTRRMPATCKSREARRRLTRPAATPTMRGTMKATLLGGFVGLASLFPVKPALAHHAFAAEFDASKPIKISGTISKLEWTNPHAWLYVDVKDENGKLTSWSFELGSPNGLMRQGWRRTSVKEGEQVTIEGYAAKDGSNIANARSITLSDGRKLFAGSPEIDGGPAK